MITSGLSQHELNLITKVLDEHEVAYQTGAAGGTEEVKLKGGRGDTSFYMIEIPHDEYEKLPASAKSKLEGLGIYPEMEAPNFDEIPDKEVVRKDPEVLKKNMRTLEIIFAVMAVIMIAFFVRKVMS